MLKSLRQPGKLISQHARLISVIAIIAIVAIVALVNRSARMIPQAEAVSNSIVISQVYGGGGNSGATYTNDFIELYNRGNTTVNVTGWSVQYSSATLSTWATTTLSGSIAPGHYFLVQESAGAGGTTPLPSPDVVASPSPIAMSATAAKVALVSNSTALSGCPTSASYVDLVAYGSTANCSETSPGPGLSNTTADIRKNGGCLDTDNNSTDFFANGPIPRNSASTINTCGGDPTQLAAFGNSTPTSADPSSNVLLQVNVTPATSPPSTGITVTGDLTSIGGSSTQQFYDDGTHGDTTAGDNIFSFQATIGAAITTGAKNIPATVTDAQARTATAGITVTVASPTCGVERWSVKVGTDPDVSLVDTSKATPVTIADMRSWPAPSPSPPPNSRVTPYESTVWLINGTMTVYKKETDVDYHIVVQDGSGNTLVTEIPCPCCAIGSPFQSMIASARQTFDARLTATTSFQTANIPVRIKGVGFFDFLHGQTGLAPNGIEIHPILEIVFPTTQSTPTQAGSNVMVQAGDATISFSNVTSPGTTTVTPIDPSTAGAPPNSNYKLIGPAYDITTTATTSGPINICFSVPSITDPASFSQLKVLHAEGGSLVDRTSGEDFNSKLICGSNIPSLSPFVVALGPGPTAAPGFISGRIAGEDGAPLEGVTVSLSGTKNERAITDSQGLYSFADVEPGGFYTLTPERANYSFSPATRSFSLNSLRADAPFTAAASAPKANPLDSTEFFVRQQYVDFLDREAEQGGLDYWSAQIRNCGGDAACIRQRRIDVSAAFFISSEFQDTGFFVYRTYKAAFGARPGYRDFTRDRSSVVGGPIMEINKATFVNDFVERAEFKRVYPLTLTPEQFVNKLFDQAGLVFSPLERQYYINAMENGAERSDVLRGLVEMDSFKENEYNRAFVLMQYFGYLRREPEDGGYLFWLDVLNNKVPNNYRAMVCAFITSAEYQDRFSPVRTRSNNECAP
ncbi:MAG: hypothetical protein QOD00_934 [Blastocatellia bacterium]|nr:hypothetical protein [Blastocatellia bacterium]